MPLTLSLQTKSDTGVRAPQRGGYRPIIERGEGGRRVVGTPCSGASKEGLVSTRPRSSKYLCLLPGFQRIPQGRERRAADAGRARISMLCGKDAVMEDHEAVGDLASPSSAPR